MDDELLKSKCLQSSEISRFVRDCYFMNKGVHKVSSLMLYAKLSDSLVLMANIVQYNLHQKLS